MHREITSHHVKGLPESYAPDLRVFAASPRPEDHGIPHVYGFEGPHGLLTTVSFQRGDPRKRWNGLTTLAMLGMLKDFLEACDRSQFACVENTVALGHVDAAMQALQRRIIRRAREGSFQTHQAEPSAVAAPASTTTTTTTTTTTDEQLPDGPQG